MKEKSLIKRFFNMIKEVIEGIRDVIAVVVFGGNGLNPPVTEADYKILHGNDDAKIRDEVRERDRDRENDVPVNERINEEELEGESVITVEMEDGTRTVITPYERGDGITGIENMSLDDFKVVVAMATKKEYDVNDDKSEVSIGKRVFNYAVDKTDNNHSVVSMTDKLSGKLIYEMNVEYGEGEDGIRYSKINTENFYINDMSFVREYAKDVANEPEFIDVIEDTGEQENDAPIVKTESVGENEEPVVSEPKKTEEECINPVILKYAELLDEDIDEIKTPEIVMDNKDEVFGDNEVSEQDDGVTNVSDLIDDDIPENETVTYDDEIDEGKNIDKGGVVLMGNPNGLSEFISNIKEAGDFVSVDVRDGQVICQKNVLETDDNCLQFQTVKECRYDLTTGENIFNDTPLPSATQNSLDSYIKENSERITEMKEYKLCNEIEEKKSGVVNGIAFEYKPSAKDNQRYLLTNASTGGEMGYFSKNTKEFESTCETKDINDAIKVTEEKCDFDINYAAQLAEDGKIDIFVSYVENDIKDEDIKKQLLDELDIRTYIVSGASRENIEQAMGYVETGRVEEKEKEVVTVGQSRKNTYDDYEI